MAVMIHPLNAIQKQQLLCGQFMECVVMVCKVIPFSWKAAFGTQSNLWKTVTGCSSYEERCLRSLTTSYYISVKEYV